MAFPNDLLFLERFIAFNKERYSDEPNIVSVLEQLTLDNTTLSDLRKVEVEGGEFARVVNIDSEGKLTGKNQRYLPADYVKNKVSMLETPDPVDWDVLQTQGVEGIYQVKRDEDIIEGAVLVFKGSRNPEHIKALIKAKCYYDLTDDEITLDGEFTQATIDSNTVTGTLAVVESQYDAIPRFNGQFRYDGTLTY